MEKSVSMGKRIDFAIINDVEGCSDNQAMFDVLVREGDWISLGTGLGEADHGFQDRSDHQYNQEEEVYEDSTYETREITFE